MTARRHGVTPCGPRVCLTGALLLILLGAGCADSAETPAVVLRFWGMGREGEVVQEMMPEFERENPGVRVRVQQIPWSAAHEKLLTGFVGGSTPDVAQLGNTWIAELAALGSLEVLDPRIAASPVVDPAFYFSGIWDTNRIEGKVYGVPWYVDTRLLFYRKDILRQAGYDSIPGSWKEWREAMEAVRRVVRENRYAIFLPTNEPTEIEIFGLQSGSPLLKDSYTRGAFTDPEFRRGFDFFLGLYRDRLAPPVRNTQIANIYQEFARGYFSMYITGPWNLGEFKRRLPPELQDSWATSPLPGPTGPESGVSLAGGSSLVIFEASRQKDAAWRLVEFLSRPEQQIRFYHLTGDLPARREAWGDSALTGDPRIRAFGVQLDRVVSSPKVPEWEEIRKRVQDRTEQAVYGASSPDSILAALQIQVDRILEKRRWLLSRRRGGDGS